MAFLPRHLCSLLKLDDLVEALDDVRGYDQRVRLVLKTLQANFGGIPLDHVQSEAKSAETSENLRRRADRLMLGAGCRDEEWFAALDMYQRSVARAPPKSPELARAYGNRSTALLRLNKPQDCVKDIDLALGVGYPEHLRANLLRRKAKQLKKMGRPEEADAVAEEARLWLEKVQLTDRKKRRLEERIDAATRDPDYETPESHKRQLQRLDLALDDGERHPQLDNCSTAVDLEYDAASRGRHLVASKTIRPGELLVLEPPYASCLATKRIYSHCSHCLARLWHSVACDSCVSALYCSDECKSRAWLEYHDYECRVRAQLLAMSMNDTMIFALKLTIKAVKEFGGVIKLRRETKNIAKCEDYLAKSFSKDGVYRSDRYRACYSLLSHSDRRRDRHERVQLSLSSALILYYLLKLTPIFGGSGSTRQGDEDIVTELYDSREALFVGKLIVQHYMQLQVNGALFNEYRNFEYFPIGGMLGPVVSLLNHSCNPNVARCSFIKDNRIYQAVYALKAIDEGVELVEDYGCRFPGTPIEQRRKKLAPYFFTCTCEACEGNWPLIDDLPSIISLVPEKDKCLEVVRAVVRSKRWERAITKLGLEYYTDDKMEILQTYIDSISRVNPITREPSRELTDMLEQFRQCFWYIYGNQFDYIPFLT
ncbi:hypothetical protein TKK_0003970 [Trichogramma kaykai]|uniref:MYND-type domain-containing protein n=1 Tax=Trichogramma kaykai TaxID=54128 RepID=A0ABD2XPF4_9HYME